jgi:hypothetical protein
MRISLSIRAEEHILCCGGGSSFAEIQEGCAAIGQANEHKPSSADVSCLRICHCKGKSNRHSSIHCIAAPLQDFKAGVGGKGISADHHRMLCTPLPKAARSPTQQYDRT